MLKFPADESTVLILLERVNEAQRLAVRELKEMQANDPRNKKRRRGEGDEGGGNAGRMRDADGDGDDGGEGFEFGGGGGGGDERGGLVRVERN